MREKKNNTFVTKTTIIRRIGDLLRYMCFTLHKLSAQISTKFWLGAKVKKPPTFLLCLLKQILSVKP